MGNKGSSIRIHLYFPRADGRGELSFAAWLLCLLFGILVGKEKQCGISRVLLGRRGIRGTVRKKKTNKNENNDLVVLGQFPRANG